LHDTHLSKGFVGVFYFHRWSSCPLPSSTNWSVACTRQGVCLLFRCVVATHLHSSFPRPGFWLLSAAPCNPRRRDAFQGWRVVFTRYHWRLPVPPLNRICVVVFAIVYLSYLGYCFPFWEIIVFEIMLVSLFSAVLFSDSNNVFTVPAIFWWLLQVSREDTVELVLICFSFTFETVLCGHLKELSHLFVSFPTIYI